MQHTFMFRNARALGQGERKDRNNLDGNCQDHGSQKLAFQLTTL